MEKCRYCTETPLEKCGVAFETRLKKCGILLKTAKRVFDGDFVVDRMTLDISAIIPGVHFVPGKTVIIFDEVQECANVIKCPAEVVRIASLPEFFCVFTVEFLHQCQILRVHLILQLIVYFAHIPIILHIALGGFGEKP